jgi:hypothetical protein
MKYLHDNAEDLFSIAIAAINGQIDESFIPLFIRITISLF